MIMANHHHVIHMSYRACVMTVMTRLCDGQGSLYSRNAATPRHGDSGGPLMFLLNQSLHPLSRIDVLCKNIQTLIISVSQPHFEFLCPAVKPLPMLQRLPMSSRQNQGGLGLAIMASFAQLQGTRGPHAWTQALWWHGWGL